ncbi:hypothetical protein [Streptomyces sp. NPDC014894]|uniref:hypothetical protein n=1 Tax=unclassified Streptomyces TaxID=2593676 RepID=UPI003702E764
MKRVKPLIQQANPAPEPVFRESPESLREGLASVVGPEAAAASAVPDPPAVRRVPPRRRGMLVTGLALGAAAAVAAVTVVALDDGAAEKPRVTVADPGGEVKEPPAGLADEPFYDSTAQLEDAADVIVRARAGKGDATDAQGPPISLTASWVLATGKGKVDGNALTIAHTTPGTGPETTDLKAGKEYVLLLDRQDDGRYTLVSSTQGVYAVGSGRAEAAGDNPVRLSDGVLKALGLKG